MNLLKDYGYVVFHPRFFLNGRNFAVFEILDPIFFHISKIFFLLFVQKISGVTVLLPPILGVGRFPPPTPSHIVSI